MMHNCYNRGETEKWFMEFFGMKDFYEKKSKQKGTFIVKVENNSNSTWQGEIVWAEENRSEKFRSALELFKMMNGALDSQCMGKSTETDARIG